MKIRAFPDKESLGQAMAERAAEVLRQALAARGEATFIAATGASQFEFLAALVRQPGIAWERTCMFHLDEYVGMKDTHPASFRGYLKERLLRHIRPKQVRLIVGDAPDLAAEVAALNRELAGRRVDVAFVGIGENGHLAFNDPPADFTNESPYLVVNLDEACRRQQLGEGWFKSLAEVPTQAISMSVRQIMKAGAIICTVPDRRKAQAVADCFTGEVSPLHPASILQQHCDCLVGLDQAAASLLPPKALERFR